MFWTIAVVLFFLWVLGIAASYILFGFIHVLLLIAIVVVLMGIVQGRRSV